MAWSESNHYAEHDVLLSVSEEGELAFWTLDEEIETQWKCTGRVRTSREGITMAKCSSAKKSALGMFLGKCSWMKSDGLGQPVVPGTNGEELTIWDSKESEFSSGLEYSSLYRYHPCAMQGPHLDVSFQLLRTD